MKTMTMILLGLIFTVGCSRQSLNQPAKQPDAQYEYFTMDMWDDSVNTIFTNYCLVTYTATDTATNREYTDVYSLEQTGNILGQYGWRLVTTENNGTKEKWYMERQVRQDRKWFALINSSAAELQSK